MGLLDKGGATAKTQANPDEFKAKKAEAAKRFKENKAARAKQTFENSLKLRDELVKAQIFDRLTPPVKEFIVSLCKDPAERKVNAGTGGVPGIFTQLFGDKPAVGQEITLEQALTRTYKGKSTLDVHRKRWAEKGIVVDFVQAEKMLESKYIVKALPAG